MNLGVMAGDQRAHTLAIQDANPRRRAVLAIGRSSSKIAQEDYAVKGAEGRVKDGLI